MRYIIMLILAMFLASLLAGRIGDPAFDDPTPPEPLDLQFENGSDRTFNVTFTFTSN